MKTFLGISQMPTSLISASVTTVGNFDGIHSGHRRLVDQVVRQARSQNIMSVVFTFNPHPVQVLYPERRLTRLFDLEDQREQLESLGVDVLIVEPFSQSFSRLQADAFLKRWILDPLKTQTLVVGHDFTFGADRQGTIDFLQRYCREKDIVLQIVPAVSLEGDLVSSSRIREALKNGDVDIIQRLLGRPFYLRGTVATGEGRGRGIGIPTANLQTHAETWPPLGVYATFATVGGVRRASVTNIGLSPTFDRRENLVQPRIETHIFDFDQNIYQQALKVEFVKKLRDEKRFSSVEDLKSQIQQDIVLARQLTNS